MLNMEGGRADGRPKGGIGKPETEAGRGGDWLCECAVVVVGNTLQPITPPLYLLLLGP